MKYLTIKNWEQFQHYKDRNPPWIKLHYEIMTSADWVTLADASKLLAVVCMMVGSRHEGKVPLDPNYIKRVAYLDKKPDLTPLIDCGFLIDESGCYQMLADARPETEAYREETEYIIKITHENLSISHIEEWLTAKRVSGKYLTVDEFALLEKFKDYCRAKNPKYKDYVAAFRNSFEWKDTPKKGNGNATHLNGDKPNKSERARAAGDRALKKLGIDPEGEADQGDGGSMLRQLEYLREGTGTA